MLYNSDIGYFLKLKFIIMASSIKYNEIVGKEQKQKQGAIEISNPNTTSLLDSIFDQSFLKAFTTKTEAGTKAKDEAGTKAKDERKAEDEAEAERKAKDKAKEIKKEAIGKIVVSIIFRGQDDMRKDLKEYCQLDEASYKENLGKKISEHDITMDDIQKEIKEKQTLDNMHIGSLNKIVTQGMQSLNTGGALHKEELKRYNKIISQHQKNNRNIPKIITNIINNFKLVEQVLDEKNRTPSEASAPSTPRSETSESQTSESSASSNSITARFYSYLSKAYSFFKSSKGDYNQISTDDSQSTRSFSSTTSSSESEGSKSSTSSVFSTLKKLISTRIDTSTENQDKQAVNKIKGDTPKILEGIVSNISTKLQQINDDAIQQFQARAEEHKKNLEKIELDKAKKEAEQAKQDEKKEENQRRKALEEVRIKKLTAVLTKQYQEQINRLPKENNKQETVITLTIKNTQTKNSITIEITAKDLKSVGASNLARKTIENACSFAQGTKTVAKNSYNIAKFMTTPSPSANSESMFKTLKNMSVILKGDRNIDPINFTDYLPAAFQYFNKGMRETPGASLVAARSGSNFVLNTLRDARSSLKSASSRINSTEVRASTHQR